MSFLTTFEKPFTWIEGEAKTAIDALVPATLKAEIGTFAHTFVANIVHDFGAEAKALALPVIEQVWSDLKTSAASLAALYMKGGISFEDLIGLGVKALKSESATVVVPALTQVSQQTISNWLPNLVTTSLAAAMAANPPSASASSPAKSAPAS